MLRLLILLLLLANVAYFAWNQGALAKLGITPAPQTEAERLQQQVHPERLLVTPAASATTIPALVAPLAPTEAASAPAR
ncbi:MAG: hypothetical protein Q7U05_07400 [Polaromonas sp.]|jgi:hypothetical protein|nr:hypothetical protein [Polaromonas sp.]